MALEVLSTFRLVDVEVVCAREGQGRARFDGAPARAGSQAAGALGRAVGQLPGPATISRPLAPPGGRAGDCYRVRPCHRIPLRGSGLDLASRPAPAPARRAGPDRHRRVADGDPVPAVRRDRLDWFGNRATHLAVHERHNRLSVTSELELEVDPPPPPDNDGPGKWRATAVRTRATIRTRARPSRWRCLRRASGRRPRRTSWPPRCSPAGAPRSRRRGL